MKLTKVFEKTIKAFNSGYTIISNVGSTRSSKTYSILQLLYFIACKKQNLTITITSATLPHLKRGCLRDFENILKGESFAGIKSINKTDRVYEFTTGSKVEFFSIDSSAKVHGAQRDILYINECNFIDYEKVRQLFIRTSGVKFLDYNPSNRFWIDNLRMLNGFIEIHSTYKDNDFLSPEQIATIEANKSNPRWWSIYGLGLTPENDGKVYSYEEGSFIQSERKRVFGLDFGWRDPCALVEVNLVDKKLYVKEWLYKSGLSVDALYESIKDIVGNNVVICDSAEPQIIEYLKKKGLKVFAAKKGRIVGELQTLSGLSLVAEGENLVKELDNYTFKRDELGEFTSEPVDKYNHLLDAMRYVSMHQLINPYKDYTIRIL